MRVVIYLFALLAFYVFLLGFVYDTMISGTLVAALCFTVLIVAIFTYFRKFI